MGKETSFKFEKEFEKEIEKQFRMILKILRQIEKGEM